MPSTFFGFEIARRGLISSQIAQNIISHNIVNANTPGYTKQRTEISTTLPFPYPTHNREIIIGQIGTGVAIDYITGIRDKILEARIKEVISDEQYYNLLFEKTDEIQSIINEPGDINLNQAINSFFNAFNDIGSNPENLSIRQNLINITQGIVKEFKFLKEKVNKMSEDANKFLKNTVLIINNLAENIKDINLEIFRAINLGYNPNDLIDKRNNYLNELAKFTNYQITELNNGIIKVEINGHILVGENYVIKLDTAIVAGTNNLKPIFTDGQDLISASGQIKSIIDFRDNYLNDYYNRLNEIAISLINEVNNLHLSGYGLNQGSPSGLNYFIGTGIDDIDINPQIINDITLIAAAKNPFSPGDGSNALDISNLKYKRILQGNALTINEAYQAFVSKIGADTHFADNNLYIYKTINNNLYQKRESLSGISLDEEMTELIKFQHAYSANLKVMKVQDEIIENLINIIK